MLGFCLLFFVLKGLFCHEIVFQQKLGKNALDKLKNEWVRVDDEWEKEGNEWEKVENEWEKVKKSGK